MKRRPFHGQVTSVVSHSRVFSWAMIWTPALPRVSFEPVCSGCQWVLNSVRTGPAPGSAATAFSKRLGGRGGRAVHQHDTAGGGVRDDVGRTGDRHDEQVVAQPDHGRVGRRLPAGGEETGRAGQSNACRAAEGGFQEVPA